MSLTLYVGHSVAEAETAFLWEFQANAAAHGFKVVLAQYTPVPSLTASREAAIRNADAFLAVVTRPAPHVEEEVKFARDQNKPIFVYTWQGVQFNAPGAIVIRVEPEHHRARAACRRIAETPAPSTVGDGATLASSRSSSFAFGRNR